MCAYRHTRIRKIRWCDTRMRTGSSLISELHCTYIKFMFCLFVGILINRLWSYLEIFAELCKKLKMVRERSFQLFRYREN